MEAHKLEALKKTNAELLLALRGLLRHAENPGGSHENTRELAYKFGWVECCDCLQTWDASDPPVAAAVQFERSLTTSVDIGAPLLWSHDPLGG